MEIEKRLEQVTITDEELMLQIEKEYQNALDFRKPVINDWHANEDMLYGKKPKTMSKRSNINLWLMHGFVYTFLSKIKNQPVVKFEPTEDADTRKAKKVTALFEIETSATKENWRFKDLSGKKAGMASGRVIEKIVAESPYKHRRYRVDHYDFLIDPLAGGFDIENARYMGQDNIYKTKHDLRNNDEYDQEQVEKLISLFEENNNPEIENEAKEKSNRFAILGLNPEHYNYQSGGVYKLLEWYTYVNGIKYCVLCNLEKKIIIKKNPLEDIIGLTNKDDENPLWPFGSWAYFPDEFNFWSIAPMTIVRENFQTRNIIMNQAIDNNEDKNKPSISYDPDVYKEPSRLERDRSGKLIPTARGKNPKEGMFIHPVNDIYDPIKLSAVLEDIVSKVMAVTPEGQGLANKDQKVGIYYGNQAEVADRMSLFEESYSMFTIRLAMHYLQGLKDRMTEPIAIKMIGEKGAEWDKVMKEDLGDFDIIISGGSAEARNDEIEKKNKLEYLAMNKQNPIVNPKWIVEQELSLIGFDQASIKQALEIEPVDEDLLSEASQDIQGLMNGEQVKPNPKATSQYMQKILDFYNKTEITKEQNDRFVLYLQELEPIAVRNMMKKAQQDAQMKALEMAQNQPIAPQGPPQAPASPPQGGLQPNTKGATIERSSQLTNNLKENYA